MSEVRRGLDIRTMRGGIVAGVSALLFLSVMVATSPAAAPLSIKIEGNHFIDGEGQTVRLLGVDVTSSEYACADDYGFDDGHFDDEDAAQIASWNADAVRMPLNEDCWLGINLPAGDPYGGVGYQHEVEQYVADLNAHGIYPILDLHWTAPGNQTALEQQPMPDKDHSIAFWEQVAKAFKGDPAVVFDVFNEPYDPTDIRSGSDENTSDAVSWECWEYGTKKAIIGGGAPNEPCYTQAYDDKENPTTRYQIAGMQTLVDAIRKVGATQPVMTGGLDYADDLSQWVEHAPDDPLNQEAASFHNYTGKECDNVGCWNKEIAPVAADVPVVTGEFAEDNYEEPACPEGPNNFDDEYMNWADAHGVSYLAWAWLVPDPIEPGEDACDRQYLIGDYSGTPASVNGIAVHHHLLTLPSGGRTVTGTTGGGSGPAGSKIKLLRFRPKVMRRRKVSFELETVESCRARISGRTVKSYRFGDHKPRTVALGSGKVSLTADKPATVTIKIPAKAFQLLGSQGSSKARFTVTLKGAGDTTTVASHTIALKEPRAK